MKYHSFEINTKENDRIALLRMLKNHCGMPFKKAKAFLDTHPALWNYPKDTLSGLWMEGIRDGRSEKGFPYAASHNAADLQALGIKARIIEEEHELDWERDARILRENFEAAMEWKKTLPPHLAKHLESVADYVRSECIATG